MGIAERESEEMAPKRERESLGTRERERVQRGVAVSKSSRFSVLNITEIDFKVILEYLMVPLLTERTRWIR